MTLICFGAAGTGGSQFRAWNRLAPAWLQVIGVQLPGREQRYRETPLTCCAALAQQVAAAITMRPGLDFAFFGHSFGALLAFETTRQLRRMSARQPCWIGVAGRSAPHLPHTYRKTYALPEREFIDVLRSYGGSDPRILDKPELMGFFLPAIRADLEVNTEYVYQIEAPLEAPLMAMRGRHDKVCSAAESLAWRDLTTARFETYEADGGHFFFSRNINPLLNIITSALASLAVCPAHSLPTADP